MEKGFICGLTEENSRATGSKIRCTEMVLSPGQTVASIWVSTPTIVKMATVSSSGQTVDPTKETGRMESNTEKACTSRRKDLRSTESGKTERDIDGYAEMAVKEISETSTNVSLSTYFEKRTIY